VDKFLLSYCSTPKILIKEDFPRHTDMEFMLLALYNTKPGIVNVKLSKSVQNNERISCRIVS